MSVGERTVSIEAKGEGSSTPSSNRYAQPFTRNQSASSVQDYIPQFAAAAVLANAASVWLMLSPLDKGDESYNKLLGVVEIVGVLRRHGLDVRLARAGRYGPALVAAGASGFDAGAGLGDTIDVKSTVLSRRQPPPPKKPSGVEAKENDGRAARVYVPSVGHSLPRSQIQGLFDKEPSTRALLGCADAFCCPTVDVMLKDWRGHTVRARAQGALRLMEVPSIRRLGYATDRVGSELASISQVNRHLAAAGHSTIKDRGPRELQQVLEHLRSKKSIGDAA